MTKQIRKIPAMPKYILICPNIYGPNSADSVEVINRRVSIEECQKCKFYKGFEVDGIYVKCSYSSKKRRKK